VSLNLDFEDLRRHVRRLQNAKIDRRLELPELEALAEGAFRLALHPSTPNDERVGLLALAHLHAPTNPKFSFHMGLLYLKRGDLDRAALWLGSAVRKVPNSHRIWVHISLLQNQLNARYASQPEYEKNALRDLSADVKRLVREGAERFPADLMRFRPPRSAAQPGHGRRPHEALEAPEGAAPDAPEPSPLPYARRLVDEGSCRWPSVYLLTLEDTLQAEYSRRSLERALPLMEHTIRTAAGRRGGAGAFAVAAIQWLAAGYPDDEVGRWRESLADPEPGPALELVDRALELYRAPVEELPELLRRTLADQAVPVYLAALIHYQRQMAPALPEFKEFAAFRLARAAVRGERPAGDEVIDEEDVDLRRKLARALDRLRTEDGEAAPRASRPQPGAGGVAGGSWDDLQADAALLKDAHEQVSSRARELMTSACREDLAGSELERLIVEGHHLLSVHGEMRELAAILSRECDAHLAAASTSTGGAGGAIEAERALREVLNRVCYWSLRYLEDEIELRAASAEPRRGPEPPPDPIVRSVENSIAALRRARTEGEGSEVAAAAEVFLEAERVAPRLVELQGRLFDELKAARTEAKGGGTPDEVADLRRRVRQLEQAVDSCARGSDESLQRLAAATDRLSGLPEAAVEERVGGHYPARRETTKKLLAQLGSLGRFKRVLQQIDRAVESEPKGGAVPGVAAAGTGPIGAEIERLLARLGGKAPTESAGSEPGGPGDPPTPPHGGPADPAADGSGDPLPEEEATARATGGTETEASPPEEASLEEILVAIVAALTEAFARCRRSLEASFGSRRGETEVRTLAAALDSREAETFHALGLRRRARRIWERMSRGRPADLGLLRNVAVCASYEPDPALALTAWRRCLEALYYYDAALGKPNVLAPERRQLHEGIGMALLPQALPRFFFDGGKVAPDERSRASLIERHEQMREFVAHMTLKFLNLKVDFGSPLLFLGVDRGESPDVRAVAAGKLGSWCDRLAAELDWPVFGLYLDRVRGHVGDQLEICRDPANLTHRRDRRFQVEKARQLEWVMEAGLLKLRLRSLLLAGDQGYLDYVSWPATIRFIDAMVRLDEIPVDLSPSFLEDIALELQIAPGQLVDAARSTGALLIHQKFGRRPLTEGGDFSEPLYRRMLDAWSSSRLIGMEDPVGDLFGYRRLEAFLDDPFPLYRDQAHRIAREATDYSAVIDFLKSWGERYPGITGPQRQAAQLLAKNDLSRRAAELLSSCLEAARYPAGSAECRKLLKTLKAHGHVEAEQFGEALPTLRERVEEDREGKVATLAQYLRIFARHALERREDPGHEEMMATVESWLERFRETLGAADVRQILQRRDQALIVAFTAHLGDIEDDGVDPRSTREVLSRLIDTYPDVIDAYAWRMQASFKVAERDLDRGRESSALRALMQVRKDADYVQRLSTDEDRRALAERYMRDAERLST